MYYNSLTVSGSNYNIYSTGSGNIYDGALSGVPNGFIESCPFNCYDENKFDVTNLDVTSNITYNQTTLLSAFDHGDGVMRIGGTLTIKSGKTLTLSGQMKIEFGENGKIVVERGARLIANGNAAGKVEFTSAEFCKKGMWEGIQVWGKSDENQGSYNQGYVNFTNVIISNARNGIITDNTTVPLHNRSVYYGGIIYCDNVDFINNRKSAAFLSYKNMIWHSYNSSFVEHNNYSYFKHCNFTINDYMKDPQYKTADGRPFAGDAQVSMWDVKNVLFQNCTFTNSVSHADLTTPGYWSDTRGVAIYAVDAALHMAGGTSVGGGNYSTQNTFTGFSDAVWCMNTTMTDALDYILIDRNKFIDNIHGVTLEGTQFSNVNRNHFEIPAHEYNPACPNTALLKGYNKPTGLYLKGSTNFIVQENEFYDNSTVSAETTSDKYNYGIVVNNSAGSTDVSAGDGFASGLVYKNKFKNMNVSLQAELDNKGDNSSFNTHLNGRFTGAGLEYKCNEFLVRNSNDFDVTVPDGVGNSQYSTLRNQGLCIDPFTNNAAPSLQAGNTYNGCSSADFSQLEFGTNSIGNNQSFIYRDYGLAMPTCSNGTLVTCFNPNPSDPDIPNPCPSYYTILSTITAIRDQYFITQGMATNSNTAYKNLLDGGNTEALLNEISTSTDLAALKSLLLSKSPYLSDAVLTQAIGREDTLSATAIKELVIANSPVTMSVLNAMKRRTYLSKINDSIAPYQTGISARSERENEADYYAFQANRATIQLKQAYLETGNLDSLAEVSKKDSTLMGMFNMINVYITDGDFTRAQSVLDEIFTREGANISDKTKLNAMSLVLAYQNKTWFDLPDSLMNVVQQIYENHPETAIQARAILALTRGLKYDRYPFDLGAGEKRMTHSIPLNEPGKVKNKMKIYPNPSNEITNVDITIGEGQTEKVSLYNLLGVKLFEDILKTGNNNLRIDNQKMNNGIYFYMLEDVNTLEVLDKQKVIISK